MIYYTLISNQNYITLCAINNRLLDHLLFRSSDSFEPGSLTGGYAEADPTSISAFAVLYD